jgi:hypothetical protein
LALKNKKSDVRRWPPGLIAEGIGCQDAGKQAVRVSRNQAAGHRVSGYGAGRADFIGFLDRLFGLILYFDMIHWRMQERYEKRAGGGSSFSGYK